MLRRLLGNVLHQKYWTRGLIYEVIKKNITYAYNLHIIITNKYAVSEKIPPQSAPSGLRSEGGGGSQRPPLPPSHMKLKNSPVQFGLMLWILVSVALKKWYVSVDTQWMTQPIQKCSYDSFWCLVPDIFLGRTIGRLKLAANFLWSLVIFWYTICPKKNYNQTFRINNFKSLKWIKVRFSVMNI